MFSTFTETLSYYAVRFERRVCRDLPDLVLPSGSQTAYSCPRHLTRNVQLACAAHPGRPGPVVLSSPHYGCARCKSISIADTLPPRCRKPPAGASAGFPNVAVVHLTL